MNAFRTGATRAVIASQMKLGVLLLAAGSVSAWAQDDQRDPNIVGTLQQVEGVVLVKEGDVSIPASEGQVLRDAQEVLVTEGAKALIVFNDGCDMVLDAEELYSVPSTSPCASLWWAAPAAAGVGCAGAHVSNSSNARTLAAVGLAVGAGLLGTSQGRETDFPEYAAALEVAEGSVMARNANGALEVVRPGTRLFADQELVVSDNAKALIRFDDGCTKEVEVGNDDKESYFIPHNSPCFSPGLWWASSAAAAGLCVTVEDNTDSTSP